MADGPAGRNGTRQRADGLRENGQTDWILRYRESVMRNGRTLMMAALAMLLGASAAVAQSFSGEGRDLTKSFPLAEGTAVVEFEHRGAGAFVVQLVDEDGNAIDEVARGAGTFGGSKAIRIGRSGNFMFDIEAPGKWTVRVLSMEAGGEDSEAGRLGAERGRADAGTPGTGSWLGRGFLGGLVGGPLGISFVLGRAVRSAERDADAAQAALSGSDAAWAAAYRDAFAERLRSRRQRSATIGGVVGTGILVYALIRAIDLGSGEQNDVIDDTGGGSPFIVVPIRF